MPFQDKPTNDPQELKFVKTSQKYDNFIPDVIQPGNLINGDIKKAEILTLILNQFLRLLFLIVSFRYLIGRWIRLCQM